MNTKFTVLIVAVSLLVGVVSAVDPNTDSYVKSSSNGVALVPQTLNVWLKPTSAGGSVLTQNFQVKIQPKSTTALDIFLLEDLSGSFGDDLYNLRNMVTALVRDVRREYSDAWFGLGSYIDKPNSPFGRSGDYEYKTHVPMTSYTSVLQNAVNGLRVKSGGDSPEAQLTGLLQVARRAASSAGFRTNSRRIIVLSTDAAYHQAGDGKRYYSSWRSNDGDGVVSSNEDYPSVSQVRQALIDANIVPIFCVTSNVLATYQGLVTKLGFGAATTLSSSSSNLISAIRSGLDDIRTSIVATVKSDPQGFVMQAPQPSTQLAQSWETSKTFSIKLGYATKGARVNGQVVIGVLGIGLITINVDVNLHPDVVAPSTVQVDEDSRVRVALSGSDPDGNSLRYRITEMPAKGKVYQDDGTTQITSTSTYLDNNRFWYEPVTGQSGSPYTYMSVRSYDSLLELVQLSSFPKRIRVNVIEKPDPPVGTLNAITGDEDTTIVGTLTGTDPEGFTAFTARISVLPNRGTLMQYDNTPITSVGTTVTDSQRRIKYRAPLNANGNGYTSFGYQLRDDQSLWSVSKTVSVNVNPVNDPPQARIAANPVTVKEQVDAFIELSAFDVDSTSFTYTIVQAPAKGIMYQCTGTSTKNAGATIGDNTVVTFQSNNKAYIAYNSNSDEFGLNYATFRFKVADNLNAESSIVTVTINVQNTIDPPTASYTPNPAQGTEDTNLQLTLTGNSIDAPLRTVNKVVIETLPAKGTLRERTGATLGNVINSVPATFNVASKQIMYVPDLNDNGAVASFDFRVEDGVASASVNVPINLTPVNDAPVALDQTVNVDERTDTVIQLRATDVDSPGASNAPGSSVIVTSVPGTKGKLYQWTTGNVRGAEITGSNTAVTDSNNRVIYNSTLVAFGDAFDTFTYRWTDPQGAQSANVATTTINVRNSILDKPTANAQTVSTNEDTDRLITITGSSNDGKAFKNFRITSLPTKGTLYQATAGDARGAAITATNTIVTNAASFSGKVIFAPAPNGNGNSYDTFQFALADVGDSGYSSPATVTVDVTPVNDKPVASALTPVVMVEDGEVVVDLVGSDVDGNPTTAIITSLTANGGQFRQQNAAGAVLSVSDTVASKKVWYKPPANAHSSPAGATYASFAFRVRDNSGDAGTQDSDPFTVNIVVSSVPDAPTPAFQPNPATLSEDGSILITLTGTSIDQTGTMDASVTELPLNGRLFQVDGSGTETTQITSVPAAVTASTTTPLGKRLKYVPDTNYNGAETFSFQVDDGTPSATAQASMTITPVNDKPTAVAATPVNTLEDSHVTMELKGSDVETAVAGLTWIITAVPAQGNLYNGAATSGTPLAVNDQVTDGARRVTYVPPANAHSDPSTQPLTSFSFKVRDGDNLDSDAFQVNVVVEPVNDAPTSQDVGVVTNEDTAVVLTFPGSDIDTGDSVIAVLDSLPSKGQLYQVAADGVTRGAAVNMSAEGEVTVVNTARKLIYEPVANEHGAPYVTFNFLVRDSSGVDSALQTATINVTSVQDPPRAFADSPVSVDEDFQLIVKLNGADDDFPAGTQPVLNLTITQVPTCLTFAAPRPRCTLMQSDGTQITSAPALVTSDQGLVTFQAGRNEHGTDYARLRFTATDGIETSPEVEVQIDVNPVNDLPVYSPVAFLVTPEDTPKLLTVNGVDEDGPNNPPHLVILKAPTHGRMHAFDATAANGVGQPLQATGSPARYETGDTRAMYVPDANYYGRDLIEWTVNDGVADAQQPWKTVVIVSGQNDAPVVTVLKDSFSTTVGEQVALTNVTATDVDSGVHEVTLTLSKTNAKSNLTLGDNRLSVVSTDANTQVYNGPIAAVNEALSRLFYVLGELADNKTTEETITITVNDNGFSQSDRRLQGTPLEDSKTITVKVSPKAADFEPVNNFVPEMAGAAAAGVIGAAAAFKGLRYFGAAKDAEILNHEAVPDAAFTDNPLHEGTGGWQGNAMYNTGEP